jgi:hypothetical protein
MQCAQQAPVVRRKPPGQLSRQPKPAAKLLPTSLTHTMTKYRLFATMLLFGLWVGAATAHAQKEKSRDVTNFPFFTAKKRGNVPQFVPGLTAALQLTEEQKEKIVAAREEIMGSENVQAVRRMSKADPNVTQAQREAARETLEKAADSLQQRAGAILTAGQKELIAKINDAYERAADGAVESLQSEFIDAKGDPTAMERLRENVKVKTEEDFLKALDGILSPEQKKAMATAAEVEKQHTKESSSFKKGVK